MYVCMYVWLVHTAETVLSRLDLVSTSFVLSASRRRCEHNWRRDKTVLSCRVGGVNTTADKTRQDQGSRLPAGGPGLSSPGGGYWTGSMRVYR